MFNFTTVMANDNVMTNMGTAIITSNANLTGVGDLSGLSAPVVYVGQDGIHARFNLSQSNSPLRIQVVDLLGRVLYRNTVKNLVAGMQYIDLSFSDFENHGKGRQNHQRITRKTGSKTYFHH